MSLIKRPSPAALMLLLALVGFVAVLGGVYLEYGQAWTLIVGGVVALTVGLLADV